MVSGHIWDDHARRGQTMFVSSEAPRSIEHKKEPVTRSPFFFLRKPKENHHPFIDQNHRHHRPKGAHSTPRQRNGLHE